MTEYFVNNRTGEVHESDCPRVKVIKSKTVWDPAKADLTVGVYADRICLHGQLPLRQGPSYGSITVRLGLVDDDALSAPERRIAAALYERWPHPEGNAVQIKVADPRTVAQVAWKAVTGA